MIFIEKNSDFLYFLVCLKDETLLFQNETLLFQVE